MPRLVLLSALVAGATTLAMAAPAGAAPPAPAAGSSAAGVSSAPDVSAASTACVPGDLNGDGHGPDMAVGDPDAAAGGKLKAGAVWIRPVRSTSGFTTGIRYAKGQRGVPGVASTGARFGARLAVADLNADGCDDLVVSAPREARGTRTGAGSVTVLFGSPDGLGKGVAPATLTATSAGGSPQGGEGFGSVLATAKANGARPAVLAIGRPGYNFAGAADAGAVTLFRFNAAGRKSSAVTITQNSAHVAGAAEKGDRFGSALGFTYVDLVVGVPGEDGARGRVQILTGSRNGTAPTGSHDWSLNTSGVPGSPVAGDRFGAALAVDIDGITGGMDVAIGLPGRDVGTATNAGAVVRAGIYPRFALTDALFITQDTKDVADKAETGDGFGSVIAYNTCWSSLFRECLVVGIPGEDIGAVKDAGAIWTMVNYSKVPGEWDFFLSQDSAGIPGSARAGHRFGAALSMRNINNLWIGVPGDTEHPHGSVIAIPWSRIHRTDSSVGQLWSPASGTSTGSAL